MQLQREHNLQEPGYSKAEREIYRLAAEKALAETLARHKRRINDAYNFDATIPHLG